MKLKICGLQPGDDLSFTTYQEVTHVGFVLVPASRRYVPPQEAAKMSALVDARCRKVGVFVNTAVDEVIRSASVAGLDVVQLHGNETPEDCLALQDAGFEVWKALSVSRVERDMEDTVELIRSFGDSVDAILLDAAPPKNAEQTVTGGHGLRFNWSKLPELKRRLSQSGKQFAELPIWIAGGITPENTPELLREFLPYGLDVSSGVEVDKRKSLNRIKAMREAVSQDADSATAR